MALGPVIFLAMLTLLHQPLMVSDDTDPETLDRIQAHKNRMTHEMGRLQAEFDLPAKDRTSDGLDDVVLTLLLLLSIPILLVKYIIYSKEEELSDYSTTDSYGSATDSYGSATDSYGSATDSYGSSTIEQDDNTEPDMCRSNQPMLEMLCDCHVQMETGDRISTCDFVTSFVDHLLEVWRRTLPYWNTLPLLEKCIGVGSAFEGWHTQVSQAYTVLVPLLPPKGHSFQIETSDSEGALSRHGRISVETECVCKRERLPRDGVCALHHPKRQLSDGTQVLCRGSHLDAEKTIHWFQKLVAKAWCDLYQSYNLDLVPQPSDTACCLKLGFRSGKSISIDIILGVQQGDSSVFLVTQDSEMDRAAGTIWRETFAVQELLFFKWVRRRLPEDNCHLKCLQILINFRESRSSYRNPVLTNYHLKTSLMHLLLLRSPLAWQREYFQVALQDVISYLYTALQRKDLKHFLIGNHSLPIHISLPWAFLSAAPPNLFAPLGADPDLHAEAMKEFIEVAQLVQEERINLEE
ncbi:inositol 1,4,5-trisphosphate receptor-interacting protein-like 1 [Pogona vitticeps]